MTDNEFDSQKPTFIERLNATYSGQFTVERKVGMPPTDIVRFVPPNKNFGNVEILGDLDEWRDEEDYYCEDEDGIYDDADTCGFQFRSEGVHKITPSMSPTEIFDLLNEIFSDRVVCYKSVFAKKRKLYPIKEFEKALKEKRVRHKEAYTFWTGEHPIKL
jgi:hypothetical protein